MQTLIHSPIRLIQSFVTAILDLIGSVQWLNQAHTVGMEVVTFRIISFFTLDRSTTPVLAKQPDGHTPSVNNIDEVVPPSPSLEHYAPSIVIQTEFG